MTLFAAIIVTLCGCAVFFFTLGCLCGVLITKSDEPANARQATVGIYVASRPRQWVKRTKEEPWQLN